MTSSLPTRAALAVTLALSATAAPAVAAGFNLEPGPPVQSQTANHRPQVHAGPNQPATGIPSILPAPPPALRAEIRQDELQKAQRFAYTVPADAPYSSAATNGYVNAKAPSVPGTVVHVVAHNDSFHWGDAGIGAAGGVMLVMVGAGTAFAVTQQRRTRRPKGSATAAS
jgi:hypothetical protein